MNDVARFLIVAGLVLLLAGLVVWAAAAIGLGRRPGDVAFERPGVRIAFPIVTSIVVSVILTVVLNIAIRLWR